MEHNIIEFYKNYYYPAILLDNGLKVIYKNAAALAAKMKPRVSVHIKKYLNEENFKILRDISDRKAAPRMIELKERQNRCLARCAGSVITLIFFDSINYIIDYRAETAGQINKILSEYEEQSFLCVDECNNKKMQKIRAYCQRHIANIDSRKIDSEKIHCNIRQFFDNFDRGISPFINELGCRIKVDTGKDKMFIYKLNESDFLTLNFILLSYALSISVFGNVNIQFDPDERAVIYEFIPISDSGKCGNIDLEFAALIAENNKLKLEFRTAENNINNVGEKAQIWVRFISSGGLSQAITGNNIINSEDIAVRSGIELAFLRVNLK